MLALLSAPRGRVSAARVAAWLRQLREDAAQRTVVRREDAETAPVTPERLLYVVDGGRPVNGAHRPRITALVRTG
ncbi:MAG TPA: hypothetical protein VHG08_14340 [Longimicrobium sp.]|nr:hypothetical protein [Longimicrobium sp.]